MARPNHRLRGQLTTEGLSKKDIIRYLERYVARDAYNFLRLA